MPKLRSMIHIRLHQLLQLNRYKSANFFPNTKDLQESVIFGTWIGFSTVRCCHSDSRKPHINTFTFRVYSAVNDAKNKIALRRFHFERSMFDLEQYQKTKNPIESDMNGIALWRGRVCCVCLYLTIMSKIFGFRAQFQHSHVCRYTFINCEMTNRTV